MEISIRRSDLAKELHLVQGIVERKSSIPILSNVLAEARSGELRISATDLDVSLLCGCAAQVVEEGAVTLSAKKLYEIVRSLPDSDVSLQGREGRLDPDPLRALRVPRGRPAERGLPDAARRPRRAHERDQGVAAQVADPADLLRDHGRRRPLLPGRALCCSSRRTSVTMVATDGHRLAWAQRKTEANAGEPLRALVPRKAITEIARLMEDVGPDEIVGFQSGETHLIFTVGGRTLVSKKVEAQFPAFEKVVAVTGDKKLVLGREQLLSAVRRVSLLSSERGRAVRLALEPGKLEVSASSPELGEAREALARRLRR